VLWPLALRTCGRSTHVSSRGATPDAVWSISRLVSLPLPAPPLVWPPECRLLSVSSPRLYPCPLASFRLCHRSTLCHSPACPTPQVEWALCPPLGPKEGTTSPLPEAGRGGATSCPNPPHSPAPWLLLPLHKAKRPPLSPQLGMRSFSITANSEHSTNSPLLTSAYATDLQPACHHQHHPTAPCSRHAPSACADPLPCSLRSGHRPTASVHRRRSSLPALHCSPVWHSSLPR